MALREKDLTEVCKLGQEGRCRFIIPGSSGLECSKGTFEDHINWTVEENKPGPVGDNCEGKNKDGA